MYNKPHHLYLPILSMTESIYPPHSLLTDDDDISDSVSTASTSILTSTTSIAATSITSNDISMRSISPTPSVMSLTNSMRDQIFKREYGRGLNNFSEVYRLPADDEEWDRLDKQYPLFTEIMGKYPPPLHQVMRDEGLGSEVKRCLDLGCGNGNWIMDLARDFPHCEAVAVDLVPMQSLSMPSNLRSEVDDINLGLEHFYGDFNVVHAWLIASGVSSLCRNVPSFRHRFLILGHILLTQIKDYERLIDQISRVLRPGGLIDVMEWDFCTYDANKQPVESSIDRFDPPWWSRWLAFAVAAIRNHGGDVDAPLKLETWIRRHPAFEDVVNADFWLPSSPWKIDDPALMQKSTILRDDILEFLNSGRPLLLGSGLPTEVVDLLHNNARQELLESKVKQYVKLKRVYARKKHF
ncbi:hypothetical protein AMATHDRAFT_57399 [Amanita thiersii Skay4041]|uniref:Methyltransferase domain-containing protein n=1 Tax=Amanita thiersii Skay4041 TaxID=703135 RepID=A0A2A9NQE3_9AGAR|nr:hypothetical protein AMATHDRAFT_57399 [Amanita thiersii Skay4041]